MHTIRVQHHSNSYEQQQQLNKTVESNINKTIII